MGMFQETVQAFHVLSGLNGISTPVTASLVAVVAIVVIILPHIARQILFSNPDEPPVVFHWLPLIGSTISYGIDPYEFFFRCRQRYGDIFTFVLLGKKTTVYLGIRGNDFILNGRLHEVNAEEVYGPLTTPVFGRGVVYDCPNSKLMEQKKFVKFGLTSSTLQSYVKLILSETERYFANERFKASSGSFDLPEAMAELTIFTASRSLQGKDIRDKLDTTAAALYHDLDMGFRPINLVFPWAPLPQNRLRNRAQKAMAEVYMQIIRQRRKSSRLLGREEDMIWNLMNCVYKDGSPMADHEIAHLMIALLMAGQHSSSSTISWILLRLASRPQVQDELLREQRSVFGVDEDGRIKREFPFELLMRLELHSQVIRETLRLHAPIHSMLRSVKCPMVVEGTPFTIPATHNLLAAPGVTSRMSEFFPEPLLWEPHRWDKAPGEQYAHLSPTSTANGEEKEDYGFGLISKGTASPYLPFGAGRHRCIGEQFAFAQLLTILASVISEFRLTSADGSNFAVKTDYSSMFSRPISPAMIRWVRR